MCRTPPTPHNSPNTLKVNLIKLKQNTGKRKAVGKSKTLTESAARREMFTQARINSRRERFVAVALASGRPKLQFRQEKGAVLWASHSLTNSLDSLAENREKCRVVSNGQNFLNLHIL